MKLKEEQTLVLIKPDGVKRGLIGEIIKRVEQRGLKVIALRMFQATKEDLDKHYSDSEENLKAMGEKTLATYKKYGLDPEKEVGTDDPVKIGRMVHGWIVDFMTSGPIIKMVVQGLHAVEMVRKLVGNTMPSQAEMGTIRGDYSVDSAVLANAQKRGIRNLVHASGNLAEAEHEISLWFKSEEIHEYKRAEEDIMF
ncbi:MAG: nucleoside-diphosphate kinase [Candidatus Harrisonbacteria bacterium RIFCSPHIGHO2_01_FULL_44_13]|uniref:nucleoside-diphosphate kinase n=1 Tax=Candidatus Harrisonbacteria bacterium RIFCSPLOWO2_01_FULL_44_18 TaxID=1798407 RepID=A0A1G1ZM73_9BACT|nr:MAG: nucleoside-diphosphate kinase [Candidatus Harrisonbacteria bacterium RIFCSPHIGHO2_01_FULL_44_13]OGY65539.1 MAG: nucleoside-diphosphate kinase [Candidatus Harrisonbacteria bacterium RIFCSPLOWO2_01_FULL_44_18]